MSEYIVIGTIIAAFAIAAVLSYFFTPPVKNFAHKVGAIDVPKDARRMHKKPIPRLGGLAIYGGFLCSILIFGQLDETMLCVLLGAAIIVALGIFDDVLALGAKLKFVVQIVAAAIPVCIGNLQIGLFTNLNPLSDTPFVHLGILAVPVTIIWIVGITNAVNLIDGLDGLAVGVSSIAAITMLAVALLTGNMPIAITMAALAGACIGFMPYNLNPAKIFMGDTGSTFLGYMLATVSIMGLFKFYAVISFAVPFLILGLPIFDTANAIIRRVAAGRSPMSPDRGHVHHKLIDMGFNQKQAVAILYAISATLGLTAVVLTSSGEVKAIVLLLAVLLAVCIGSFGFDTFTEKVLDIPAGSVGEALSVPMQQTARYIRDYGNEVTDDERTAIEKVLDYDAIAQSYMPELSDGVKQYYKNPGKGDLARYMLVWAKMLLKHPVCYFEATHANSHGYYTITKCRAINDYYTFNNDICMEMSEMNVHYLDKSGYLRYAFVQALSAFEKLPLVGLTTSIGFMAWLTAVLGLWLARCKAKPVLPIFIGLGIFWLTCIASPVNDCMRYFLPVAGCLPMVFCLSAVFSREKSEITV